MRPEITARVAEILRRPHGMRSRVEVWRDGARKDTFGTAGLPLRSGAVTNDATAKIRRRVTVEVPNSESLWNLLTVPGTELRPYRAVMDTSCTTVFADVPLGRMEIDTPSIGYSPSGNLSFTGNDYFAKLQAAEFLEPGIAEFGTPISSQAVTFIQQALPGVPIVNLLTSPYYVGSKVWESDRAAAVIELVEALGGELLFDAEGRAVLRLVPQLAGEAVWTVDAGESGVLIEDSASREQTLRDTRNVVKVTSSAVDGEPTFPPVYVWDDDPTSATYAGPDPVNNPGAAGPFGIRPLRFSSPHITEQAQAQTVATSLLSKSTGSTRRLSLSAIPNPGLEPGDTIAVQLPRGTDGRRLLEAHIVDSVTVPLVNDQAQQIITRAFGPTS